MQTKYIKTKIKILKDLLYMYMLQVFRIGVRSDKRYCCHSRYVSTSHCGSSHKTCTYNFVVTPNYQYCIVLTLYLWYVCANGRLLVCVYVDVCVRACVCMCVREKEREKERESRTLLFIKTTQCKTSVRILIVVRVSVRWFTYIA